MTKVWFWHISYKSAMVHSKKGCALDLLYKMKQTLSAVHPSSLLGNLLRRQHTTSIFQRSLSHLFFSCWLWVSARKRQPPVRWYTSTLGKAFGNLSRLFFSLRSVCSLGPNGTSALSIYKWPNRFCNPPTTECARGSTKLHLSNRQCKDLNLYVSTSDTVGRRRQQSLNWSRIKKYDFTCTVQQKNWRQS